MLNIKFIRENTQKVKDGCKNKQVKIDIDEILKLDEKRRKILATIEDLRAQKNKASKNIAAAKSDKDKKKIISGMKKVDQDSDKREKNFKKIEKEFQEKLSLVPNITDPDMPIGKDESGNVAIRKWGEPSHFDFPIQDHIDLGKALDLIDVEKSAEISGSRFYYLKNEAALMQFAIVQLVFNTLTDSKVLEKLAKETNNPFACPFIPIIPPVMIKPSVMKKMDRLDPIEERYELKRDDLVLVGSAEHTMGPLHMNETFSEKSLPVRYIGYSSAFRREAGSYGQDVRGILRVHQFDKLEMETFVPKEYGQVEQRFIVAIQEYLVQQLGIPYQVVQICTGDTGKPDYNQFDIECWIPSQNKYRETHTSDYMTDYQSRRLNTRYIDKEGDRQYVHMNDATAFAIGRIMIAILENYQQQDGSIKIPEVLQKYLGCNIISPKKP